MKYQNMDANDTHVVGKTVPFCRKFSCSLSPFLSSIRLGLTIPTITAPFFFVVDLLGGGSNGSVSKLSYLPGTKYPQPYLPLKNKGYPSHVIRSTRGESRVCGLISDAPASQSGSDFFGHNFLYQLGKQKKCINQNKCI